MIPIAELVLLLLVLLGIGVWAVLSGLRAARREQREVVRPQQLAGLAQPFRRQLGEAVAIQKDIEAQVTVAPTRLRGELNQLASRVADLIRRALPRAQHGTRLLAYLLELDSGEPQHQATKDSADRVESELDQFLNTLRTIRGKVYQILTDATALSADTALHSDLQEALDEVDALEEAFSEARGGLS